MPNISESNLLRYEHAVFWLFNAARKQHKNVKWRYTELLKMLTCLFSAVLLQIYKHHSQRTVKVWQSLWGEHSCDGVKLVRCNIEDVLWTCTLSSELEDVMAHVCKLTNMILYMFHVQLSSWNEYRRLSDSQCLGNYCKAEGGKKSSYLWINTSHNSLSLIPPQNQMKTAPGLKC